MWVSVFFLQLIYVYSVPYTSFLLSVCIFHITLSLYVVSMLTLNLLILSFSGFHLIWLIVPTTSLYLVIVLLLFLCIQVFLMVQFLALCFSLYALSLCLPLLIHILSLTNHLLVTYNYRCLLFLISYWSYFTLCSFMFKWCQSFSNWEHACNLKQSVKNFAFTFNCDVTVNEHVSVIARTCYLELCSLASIHRFLTNTVTATLVYAFARIDEL